jgi:uncharacterized protein (TIGR00369 family)
VTDDAAPVADLAACMPFGQLLGIEVVSADPECVVLALPWRRELCTTGDLMHGGAIMALADSVGGIVAFLNLPEGATATTTTSSATQFMAGVRSGTLTATGRPLHRGRTTIVIGTDLTDDDGRLVARVTQTQLVLR